MTIQQLEYIVAVDKYRHFVKASKACEITQSTLSSMIQKLEYELNITIFDRNVHPIKPTKIGINVINQAKIILHNFNQLKEMVLSEREQTIGKIDLGIIPTIAPYILPKLFEELKIKYPGLKIHVSEIRTNEIIENLKKAELDMAILATPLEIDDLFEIPLYYEKFVAYVSPSEPLYNITEINPS
ncbi:MAG: LysR substrate-binding domain-containing protein, partial [Bacteroidales bacterium]